MSLFKKKEQTTCSCGGNCEKDALQSQDARVKILGGGCDKCNQLEAATKAALERLGMDTAIDHVTDFTQIAAYGVMSTPALVVDGTVLSYGKVLKVDEAAKLLEKYK
jgi:small redox-active disulfide protein 2